MNLLEADTRRNLRLLSRNEGKIKAYESCSDVRAWSHDPRTRARYLREWMQCDMPICVLPVSTITSFFRTMTCRNRGRTTPRCHPDCKSKVLLETICNSCHAVKECLKNDPTFDKYFAEEEFETSHWPCDKCLEVLKSIKMFWKIIIEKIFGIEMSKVKEFDVQDRRTDNVKSVAYLWEKELLQQALFVKNVTPFLNKSYNVSKSECGQVKKDTPTRIPRPCKTDCSKDSFSSKINKTKSPTASILSQRARASDPGRSSSSFSKHMERSSRKLHRCTSIRVKTTNKSCETCNIPKEDEELKTYKKNVDVLQQKCNIQETEIDKLKEENNSLKIELQNFYKSCNWKTTLATPTECSYDKTAVIPQPFESCIENSSPVKHTDSEMIITMKNCRNESFRHVSLLQVLHKTNEPIDELENMNAPCSKKENPLDLLNKVQNTFGQIVRRELMFVNNKRFSAKHSDIDAKFYKLKSSRSAPSCSTICSETFSCDSNFSRLCE